MVAVHACSDVYSGVWSQQKVLGQDSCQEEQDLGRRPRSCQEAEILLYLGHDLGQNNLATMGKILGRNLVQELFAVCVCVDVACS